MKNRAYRRFFLLIIILASSLFYSCGQNQAPKIFVGEDFYYWESTAESNLGDAMKNARSFKKIEDKSIYNLRHILGKGSHYVWVRAEFEIPEQLKNQPLGLVIPYLRFAEQLYCNGGLISQYGMFPPHEQSTMFKAHFFSFPINILNQNGKNTILIKIYAHGLSGISTHAYVQHTRFAYSSFESINFHHTRIYIFFVGILLLTFVLYISLYISVPAFGEFRDFALVNLFTSFFLIPFFSTELPAYTSGAFHFLTFMKITMCIPPYFMVYFATLFAIEYTKRRGSKHTKYYMIIRAIILAVQVITTLAMPNYDALIGITPFMLILLGIQGTIGGIVIVKGFTDKTTRKSTIEFAIGFSPLLIAASIDIIIRILDNTQAYPYFSIFGWQISIIFFIIMLSLRFSVLYKKNERLSDHLIEEVKSRTHELEKANNELSLLNEQLEKDKSRSDMDLEMASLVQRKFLPQPNKHFRGWEIAVCYSPKAKVSGDFYDYYNYNDILNGLTLFDVSGHGLSASLVTMLSKNIISRVFQTGFRRNEGVDKILTKINNMILIEKGDIENYMTGILCRFGEDDSTGKCNVEIGNAGHPYPLKYNVRDNEIFELKGNDGKQHYGAIGMKGITVSFARSNFLMQTGDILVFYTDGLTEATNSNLEQFGLSAIKEIVKANHAKSSNEILGLIMEKLEEFTEYRGYEDDLTVIIAKRMNVNEYVKEEEHDYDFGEDVEELEPLDEQ